MTSSLLFCLTIAWGTSYGEWSQHDAEFTAAALSSTDPKFLLFVRAPDGGGAASLSAVLQHGASHNDALRACFLCHVLQAVMSAEQVPREDLRETFTKAHRFLKQRALHKSGESELKHMLVALNEWGVNHFSQFVELSRTAGWCTARSQLGDGGFRYAWDIGTAS